MRLKDVIQGMTYVLVRVGVVGFLVVLRTRGVLLLRHDH